MKDSFKRAGIRTGLLFLLFSLSALPGQAQVFIFRDINQEILWLVGNVAKDYDVRGEDSPVRFYEEYCRLYEQVSSRVEGSQAVEIVKSLHADGYYEDIGVLAQIALVYKEGFSELKEDFMVPEYLPNPQSDTYERMTRLFECLRELYEDPVLSRYFKGQYAEDYKKILEGSRDLFDETGQVLEILEDALMVPPPENFINIYPLFATPGQNSAGILKNRDGLTVAYIVTGISYDSSTRTPLFDISAELVFNMYAMGVIENARLQDPLFYEEVDRLITLKARRMAGQDDYYYPEMNYYYIIGNAQMALTAYMFGYIGNSYYRNLLTQQYAGSHIYLQQFLDILDKKFRGSGKDFYSFFPEWFAAVQPAE